MHVTPFSAATILVFATASPSHAQGVEVFGGYSVNADYVQNRPAILVADHKVSPFFSHGSGPTGFEASFKHDVRNRRSNKNARPVGLKRQAGIDGISAKDLDALRAQRRRDREHEDRRGAESGHVHVHVRPH